MLRSETLPKGAPPILACYLNGDITTTGVVSQKNVWTYDFEYFSAFGLKHMMATQLSSYASPYLNSESNFYYARTPDKNQRVGNLTFNSVSGGYKSETQASMTINLNADYWKTRSYAVGSAAPDWTFIKPVPAQFNSYTQNNIARYADMVTGASTPVLYNIAPACEWTISLLGTN
jgi:hypothetical protein